MLVVGIVAVAGGATAWASASSGPPSYRVAVAGTADIRKTMSVTGTVTPVSSATANFQVAGQVSGVKVKVGDHVSAGQVIATLDTTSLAESVSSAQPPSLLTRRS